MSVAALSTQIAPDADSRQPTVFVVDDHPDIRHAICLLARSVNLLAVAYATADEFLDNYDAETPGCLILDIRMPGMTGLELQDHLTSRGIRIPTVMITGHGEVRMAAQAMRAGALDFLPKPFSSHDLLERIHEGLRVDVENRRRENRRSYARRNLSKLSQREREVLEKLVEGRNSKQIATELGISPKTVDNHRSKVFDKMQVDNLAQLTRAMLDNRSLPA